VAGSFRFLKRFWGAVTEHVAAGDVPDLDPAALDEDQKALRRKTHQTIAKISDDIGRRQSFNTAVAAIMELLNAITRFEDASPQGRAVVRESLEAAILMLSPMAPHICHGLWEAIGHRTALVDESWPEVDEAALAIDTIEIVVQVNGKLRGRISVAADADRDAVAAAALDDPNVQRFVAGKEVRKTIVVPGRLVNIVV
jgi:leucyl-tRNA synthetase